VPLPELPEKVTVSSMQWREFTEAERGELDRDVAELAWRWARRITGLPADQAPFGPVDPRITDHDRAGAHLARLYALSQLRSSADARADADVYYAGQAGASYPEIAAALGMS